jgi:hypothetical protein
MLKTSNSKFPKKRPTIRARGSYRITFQRKKGSYRVKLLQKRIKLKVNMIVYAQLQLYENHSAQLIEGVISALSGSINDRVSSILTP